MRLNIAGPKTIMTGCRPWRTIWFDDTWRSLLPRVGAAQLWLPKPPLKTIPVVFMAGVDPVKFGLVVSLNRPGGNLTGIVQLETELIAKLLDLLHELMPNASKFAVLVNPGNPGHASVSADVQAVARKLGHQLVLVNAASASELEAGFKMLVEERAHGLIVLSDAFFSADARKLQH